MSTISVAEIQSDPKGWLRRVQSGETLVVIDHNLPVAEIRPTTARTVQPRPAGLCAGEFAVPDDFDAPLPEAVLRDFESA